MSRPKYRPVLTHSQIIHLISLCKSDMSLESRKCISVLAPFEYKIQSESISPSHIETKQSLTDQLGMSGLVTAREIPETLYAQWKADKSLLSLKEIDIALEYAYTNDLMTPEEETSYESYLISSTQKA